MHGASVPGNRNFPLLRSGNAIPLIGFHGVRIVSGCGSPVAVDRRPTRPRAGGFLACLAVGVAGCGQAKSESMKMGDRGYFTKRNRSWDLEHRTCGDPEDALVVVREAERTRCPDSSFS